MGELHRLLFICCKRKVSGGDGYPPETFSSGLGNSVRFIVDMLNASGVEAKQVEVIDNNSIDKEVYAYQPTHVFIEALWVVPEKFDVLKKLHPDVHWIVRTHSAAPFLALEGIAFEWIKGYLARGVEVNSNSEPAQHELEMVARQFSAPGQLVTYLPNFYPVPETVPPHKPNATMNIGCFGAIRVMKNQLAQAVAAVSFAARERLRLNFYINATRPEGPGANPILKNLFALFDGSPNKRLISIPWLPHAAFLKVVAKMDMTMQVSLSETFNITAADAVASGIPTIVSPQIDWLGTYAQADPGDTQSMIHALHHAWHANRHARNRAQLHDLRRYVERSRELWTERFLFH